MLKSDGMVESMAVMFETYNMGACRVARGYDSMMLVTLLNMLFSNVIEKFRAAVFKQRKKPGEK